MPKLKEELENAIRKVPNFDKLKNQIEMTITPEGLRIELLETETGTFFDLGNAGPTDNGKELLSLLAQELGKLPNHLSIEGHTDAKPYAGRHGYRNWELSTDRANAARRLMQQMACAMIRSRRSEATPIRCCALLANRSMHRTVESP